MYSTAPKNVSSARMLLESEGYRSRLPARGGTGADAMATSEYAIGFWEYPLLSEVSGDWCYRESLNKLLGNGSFALMVAERITALAIALLQDQLVAGAEAIHDAEGLTDYVDQIMLQSKFAVSLSHIAAFHAQILYETVDDMREAFVHFT